MFIQRLLTTLILLPLVLAAIYYANFWAFASALALLVLGCGLEWFQLIPLYRYITKILMVTALLLCCYVIHFVYVYWLYAGLVVWFLISLAIYQYPKLQSMWGHRSIVTFLCLLLLPLFGQSMMNVFLLDQGKALIVYLLFLVWGADIGAYLAGKLCGRHKLIPSVSPGKTLEGVAGGMALSMLMALAGWFYFQPASITGWFIVALLVIVVSLIGDLFISMLKRRTHIKDTGRILPGHGGILDRLDSLIAAAPFFYFGLTFLLSGH